MLTLRFLLILATAFVVVGYLIKSEKSGEASLEEQDPSLADLIDPTTKPEHLASGFNWIEGPVWVDKNQALLFSDIPANTVYMWSEQDGVTEYLHPSGYTGEIPFTGREPGSNGLALDDEKRLILAQHGDRRVARMMQTGEIVEIVGSYEGKRFNSPNDVIIARNGDIFFTDPPYGLPGLMKDPHKELPFQGVYRYDGNKLTLLTKEITFPNGLGFSPDEKIFYVSNSESKLPVWYAFDYDDGSLKNKRIFADVSDVVSSRKGLPDGFCVDEKGNIFASGPGGLYVFSKEGKQLGFINFGHPISNCTWGGDGSDLYITGKDTLYRLKTNTKGSK